MSVRSALARINEILDQVLNEQEGDFDTATRFAIAWYRQHGYGRGEFGGADNLARARNTSVDAVARAGIITSAAGKVKLLAPSELSAEYDVLTDDRVGIWEVLHHLIARTDTGGVQAAGMFLSEVLARPEPVDLELVKELAFLLFHAAEASGRTQDALAFNNIATSWPEIIDASHNAPVEAQLGLEMGMEG
jgi:putative DNA methylase